MKKIYPLSIVTLMTCGMCSSALAQSIDIGYLKTKDPELYKQLMAVEQCRTQAAQCQPSQPAAAAASPQTAPDSATGAAKPQGRWWYASSYADQGPYPEWLHAVQVTADLMTMDGNLDGEEFHAEVDYFSRHKTWTNLVTFIYEKDDVKQSGIVAMDKTHYAFNYGGRYDFDSTWYGQGGYIIEKDTSQSIDRQQVYYLGAGAHLINSQTVDINSMLALGRQQDKYISAFGNDLDALNYSVAYFVEQLSWHISRSISINQSFSWVQSLDTISEFGAATLAGGGVNPQCLSVAAAGDEYCVIDNAKKSKIGFTMGLEYQLNAYISLLYDFSYEKDNLPWVGVQGTDKTNSLSIRASFQ